MVLVDYLKHHPTVVQVATLHLLLGPIPLMGLLRLLVVAVVVVRKQVPVV